MVNDWVNKQVITAISEKLLDRAKRGNAQSKHGLEAAFDHEVFLFVHKLDQLLDETKLPDGYWNK